MLIGGGVTKRSTEKSDWERRNEKNNTGRYIAERIRRMRRTKTAGRKPENGVKGNN